ncbi:MAG: MMPL family transporter [Bradymonadaceae bacterium]|nr:MMPL family transporter [Lujinxingiaceae bacterium]
MNSFIDRYIRRLIARFHMLISVASLLVTALAVWVIATQWNINSDFKELLPSTSAAALAMEEVGQRVGSGSSLFVVIDSPDGAANLEFAKVYAQNLREMPEIALAHFHNDKEFFEKHRLLYMDVEDIETLHERIKKRIRDEKRQANPLFVSLRPRASTPSPGIDTSDIEKKYEELAHQDYKEYLVSDDGYSLTIVVRFVETSTDLSATNRLLDRVRQIGEDLAPTTFHLEMKLEFGGGLVHRQADYTSIVDDIKTSAVFTVVGLFLVIALYFRRARAIIIVLSPLAMGVVWTLALAFLFFGALTTVSIFIFAILLGLGIDFSIHLLSGYDHERIDGLEPVDALVGCFNSVGRATVIGAVTTFATFVVLSFAQFRGLAQFGQVASIGVLCTLLAMVTVLPSLILTLHRILPHTPNPKLMLASHAAFDRIFNPRTLARAVPVGLALSALFSVLAIMHIGELKFEENFRLVGKVEAPWERNKNEADATQTQTVRAARVAARFTEFSALAVRERIEPDSFVPDRKQLSTGAKYSSALSNKHSSTPTILLFDSADQAAKVYDHMNAKHKDGGLQTVASIAAIHAFLPGTPELQKERLAEIWRMKETLENEDLSILKDDDRKKMEEFRDLLDIDLVSIYELPDWTKRLFREAGPKAREAAPGQEFAFEYLIYVNERIDHMIGEQARRFLGEVQDVANQTEVDLRIGSQSYIYTAMLDEIKDDGAKMLGIAVVIVFLLLMIFFRSAFRAMMALTPLAVGALWMFGFCAWFGIKLDFFNVIILPVVIGLGVDDGVHFYYQYLARGRGSILHVVHTVGSAVAMTTVTSIIGFGGLAITNYAGLQSIGYLAIVGIASAFAATILLMPPILWLAEKYDLRWLLPRVKS